MTFKKSNVTTRYRKEVVWKSRYNYSLKVPKCEIFHLFDFNEFYGVKSLQAGDLRDEIKN